MFYAILTLLIGIIGMFIFADSIKDMAVCAIGYVWVKLDDAYEAITNK